MSPHPAPPVFSPLSPCSRGFIAMLEAFRDSGGTAPASTLARLLHKHPVGCAMDMDALLDTGQVFGFLWRASLWVPMFQLDVQALTPKPEPQDVRAALPPAWSGWAVASWFAQPNAMLDGRKPVDLIEADAAVVQKAAQVFSAPDRSSRWLDASPPGPLRAVRAERGASRHA